MTVAIGFWVVPTVVTAVIVVFFGVVALRAIVRAGESGAIALAWHDGTLAGRRINGNR